MNNEIKENVEPTLEYLKICVEDDILFETTNCKALLDYITNLQEEINKLTAESTEWESKCYNLQEENINIKQQLLENKISLKDVEYQEKLKYKSRIDKANEIIDEVLFVGVKNYKSQLEIIQKVINGGE